MNEVTLTPDELHLAAIVGVNRQIEAMKKGRRDTYGFDGSPWTLHIEGAAAELVIAKVTNRHWHGAVSADPATLTGDVGDGIEVRSSPREDACLIIHESDSPQRVYFLVTGQAGRYHVCGWTWGHAAQKPEFWKANVRSPAFFVPQNRLRALVVKT